MLAHESNTIHGVFNNKRIRNERKLFTGWLNTREYCWYFGIDRDIEWIDIVCTRYIIQLVL